MSSQEKEELITRWEQSGQSISAFCRGENLSYHFLRYWKRKLRSDGDSAAEAGFIKLRKIRKSRSVGRNMEVLFRNGTRLVFYDSPSPEYLRQVVL